MAKAVVPMRAFREKYGALSGDAIGSKLRELVGQFLHEAAQSDKSDKHDKPEKKREPARL
jgi:phage tail tape-measure protein